VAPRGAPRVARPVGATRHAPRVRTPLLLSLLVGLVTGCATPAGPSLPELPEGFAGVPVPPDAQQAVVVRHTDGDTLTLRGRGVGPLPGSPTKVRLLLVDTPEDAELPECGGPEASRALEALVPVGSTVSVDADRQLLDRFGRTLLHVWTPKGEHVGQRLLADGHARVLVVRPNTEHLEALRAAERFGAAFRTCPGD
jgi:micrococcal nuclease